MIVNKPISLILAATSIVTGGAVFASNLKFSTTSGISFAGFSSPGTTGDNQLIRKVPGESAKDSAVNPGMLRGPMTLSAGPAQSSAPSVDMLGGQMAIPDLVSSVVHPLDSFNDRVDISSSLNAIHADTFKRAGITSPLASGVTSLASSEALASGTVTGGTVAAVPEPETYAMLLAGLGMMAWMVRRRNKASDAGTGKVR